MELLRLAFANDEPAAPVRRKAQAVLAGSAILAGSAADVVDDVLVVISELVENVTRHTRGGGELRLAREDEVIVVEVRDGDATEPRLLPPDDRRIGGRGLLVVAGMARRWGVRREETGKTVWAEIGC
ncbi:ATP-binding protein [Actinoplanes sp. NPDC051411]|uniref:ATP-binding protein n=1 Tax=Actinoplanes sp. NPDC051411 TaxID=3155522 RepID=UPI00343F27C0